MVNANAVTTVNLTMTENTVLLNEIVAVGYGTTKKKDLTGSVTSLSTKDFNVATVSSPEQLIQGCVAGVQIISNSGAPVRAVVYAYAEAHRSMPATTLLL